MYIAIHRSKDALLALAFFIAMALVVFSTLIYFAERGVWDGTLGTFVDGEGESIRSTWMNGDSKGGRNDRKSFAIRVYPFGGLVRAC